MMIVLMRHGKPALAPQAPVLAENFKDWIAAYNSTELCESLNPGKEISELALTCNRVICSSLARSITSARLLGVQEIHQIEFKFREMEMPWGKLFGFKLKPKYWSLVFRILWFCGYSSNAESFKEAKVRAQQAAIDLEAIATEKHSLLFVGHGLLNSYIAKYLLQRGWKTKNRMGSGYWQFGIFER